MNKLTNVEQRQLARNITEWMAGPYGLPKFPVGPLVKGD